MPKCNDQVYYHMSELEPLVVNWGCRLNVVRHYYKKCPDPKKMLEIGVFKGMTCTCMGDLVSSCGGTYAGIDVRTHDDRLPVPANIRGYVEIMNSWDFWRKAVGEWNLIYVDGGHGLADAMNDVANAMQHISVGGYILVHDVANEKYPEDGPRNAFMQFFSRLDQYELELIWHDNGWMGVAKMKE